MLRKNYIDNIRWVIVLVLFPYHTFMIYNTFGESYYVKGMDIFFTSSFIVATWPWIMPLLFTIAGMSSAYALKKRTPFEYLKERCTKLFIPLLFGIVLIMPSLTYFAEKFHNGYSGNYLEQYVLFFTKSTDLTGYHGGFTPGHLWFLLYLFVISTASLPLISLYEKLQKKPNYNKMNIALLLFLFIIPLLCRPIFDIAGKSVGEYFAFFAIGYVILSDENVLQKLDKYRFLLAGLFITGCCLLVYAFNFPFDINPMLGDLIEGLYAFSAVLMFLSMGRHYFNTKNGITNFFSKSSFAVYLFHHTWIIVCAYYVFQFTDNVTAQIVLILLGSIPLTFLTYILCKRFIFTRFMFGIK